MTWYDDLLPTVLDITNRQYDILVDPRGVSTIRYRGRMDGPMT